MPRAARRRPRKPRLSRMDAAVDAMLEMGFSEGKIKRHVKNLLQVYEGDQGWRFIEECGYKVLLDSILEDGGNEEVVQDGNLSEDEEVGQDGNLSELPPDVGESSSAAAAVAGSIELPLPLPPLPPSPPRPLDDTSIPLPPPLGVTAAVGRRRVPCFGWIESDEDDDDEFIDLRPMETRMVRATLDVSKWSKKRRSRWDVKPSDL